MGIGVSLGRLAGSVALCGGMGVISAANPGFNQPDFYKNRRQANCRALKNEILKAREIARGRGMVAVNVMVALSDSEELVKTAVKAGADAVIAGAGLPLNLPRHTLGTETAAAPIVSPPQRRHPSSAGHGKGIMMFTPILWWWKAAKQAGTSAFRLTSFCRAGKRRLTELWPRQSAP